MLLYITVYHFCLIICLGQVPVCAATSFFKPPGMSLSLQTLTRHHTVAAIKENFSSADQVSAQVVHLHLTRTCLPRQFSRIISIGSVDCSASIATTQLLHAKCLRRSGKVIREGSLRNQETP